jgi:hypothetical protein
VLAYLRSRRRALAIKKKMVKFVEAFWRAVFYSAFTYLGYQALFQPEPVPWVMDTRQHWADWPQHRVFPAIVFYYHIELGCYFHQLLWTEVNRSDAMEMIAHHFITIFLIVFSYLSGFWRVGSSILLLHDISDIFLETAKVFNYSSKPASRRWMKDLIVDPIFAVFAISFFITRLVLYPRYILYSVMVEGYDNFQCSQGCGWLWVYPILLFALQGLHIFWFYLIASMVVKLAMGQMEGDVRSEEDEVIDEDEVEKKKDK